MRSTYSKQTDTYTLTRYKKLSLKFYTILMSVADDLQAVSVDEALIEVSSGVEQMASSNPAKDFAESIRAQVKEATGCTGGNTMKELKTHRLSRICSKHWYRTQYHDGPPCHSQSEARRLLPPHRRLDTSAHSYARHQGPTRVRDGGL